jgi:5-methylcytosine-specific restriction enzyme subunit McrC
MHIPIQNVYFLLCYAWNKLDEKEIVQVGATESTKLVDLFARVLINGTNHLLKRGFDRGYVSYLEDTRRPRGRIQFADTVKRRLLTGGQIHCSFDDLSYNVTHNRILKTTITNLIRTEGLDHSLRESLARLRHRLHEVEEMEISGKLFSQVRLHRNNYFYGLLLNVCELLFQNLLPTEQPGAWRFRDFLQDEAKMRILFEDFVRNFYRRELDPATYRVEGHKDIHWHLKSLGDGHDAEGLLPKMQTDLSITSEGRKVIIECKFTDAMQEHYETRRLRSDHLYQIFAYFNNLWDDQPPNTVRQAMLLYPAVNEDLSEDYRDASGWIVSVRTINLNQDWQDIRQALLALVV